MAPNVSPLTLPKRDYYCPRLGSIVRCWTTDCCWVATVGTTPAGICCRLSDIPSISIFIDHHWPIFRVPHKVNNYPFFLLAFFKLYFMLILFYSYSSIAHFLFYLTFSLVLHWFLLLTMGALYAQTHTHLYVFWDYEYIRDYKIVVEYYHTFLHTTFCFLCYR